jgi:hypothetical protein
MWLSGGEDAMTAPTIAEVGHASKGPTVVAIDGFRGRLISPYHADYDIGRAVWNGAIDRRPRLIARCIGTAEVVAAVRFARDHNLEIAIRGGGHNVAGTAVCDDGIDGSFGSSPTDLGWGYREAVVLASPGEPRSRSANRAWP